MKRPDAYEMHFLARQQRAQMMGSLLRYAIQRIKARSDNPVWLPDAPNIDAGAGASGKCAACASTGAHLETVSWPQPL